MLIGIAVITIGATVAVWINDHTAWAGPEFDEA
jgi:hypothetical protein